MLSMSYYTIPSTIRVLSTGRQNPDNECQFFEIACPVLQLAVENSGTVRHGMSGDLPTIPFCSSCAFLGVWLC